MHAKLAAFIALFVILAQFKNGSAELFDGDDDYEDDDDDDYNDRGFKGDYNRQRFGRRGRNDYDDDDDDDYDDDDDDDYDDDDEEGGFQQTYHAFQNFKSAQKKSGLSCAECKSAAKMIMDNIEVIEPEFNKVKNKDKIGKTKHLCNWADKYQKGKLLVDANMTKEKCLAEMPGFLRFWDKLRMASRSVVYANAPGFVISGACGPMYADLCTTFGNEKD